MTPPKTPVIYLSLAMLVLACYAPSLKNGWHRDDVAIVQALSPETAGQSLAQRYRNLSQMYGSSKQAGYLRPLSVLSFMAEEKIWGLNPAGFHFTSLALHVVAAVLVYAAVAVISTGFIGYLSAALFAVHPLHFETVGLVHNRNDIFCLIFLLVAFRTFVAYKKAGQTGFLCVSLAGYALALLSKETAVLFPALLMAADLRIIPGGGAAAFRQKTKIYFWYFLILGAYFVLRKTLFGEFVPATRVWGAYHFLSQEGFWWQPLVVLRILGLYMGLLFGSFRLGDFCADYFLPPVKGFFEPEILMGLAALITVTFLIIRFAKSTPVMAWGVAWFTVAYLPVSNAIFIGNMFAQHFMYAPSVGFFAVLGAMIARLSEGSEARRRLCLFLIVLLLCFWGRATFIRNYYIKNDRALWYYTAHNPWASPRAHAVLGQYYIKEGKFDEAAIELEKTISLNPGYHPAYLMLGYVYKQQGDLEKAKWYFSKGAEYALANRDQGSYHDAVTELQSLDLP